jgi:peptidoglycan/LPS O-acetylase OafA/YrhL
MPTAIPDEFKLIRRHMPELDVLRGLAVLAVIMYHGFYWSNRQIYQRPWQTRFVDATVGGWLGVNLFFILSGFLITGILLDTKPKPNYYKDFYVKRALRILPALCATLVLLVVFFHAQFYAVMVSLFFLVNYALSLGVQGTYPPLWSLAVEEHFYLLWPAVVHRCKSFTIAGIALGLCVVEPVLRYFATSLHLGDPHINTHLVSDGLAFGALLAIFARSRFATRAKSTLLASAFLLAGSAMLIVGLPHGILHRGNRIGDALQFEPFTLMFAGIVLLLLTVQLSFFASAWTWPLRYLGYISYGLYLYHLIVFFLVIRVLDRFAIIAHTGDFWDVVKRFLLMFAASVLVADVSRRWLEQPFLNMKRHLAK